MHSRKNRKRAPSAFHAKGLISAVLAMAFPAVVLAQNTYSNPTAIITPQGAPSITSGPATPYPSSIVVSGEVGTITELRVQFSVIAHQRANDIDAILVAPDGKRLVLMSDVGGATRLSNATYTFRQGFPLMSDVASNPSGTYSPTNSFVGGADLFPPPCPGSTSTVPDLAGFNGIDPNGTWSLFLVDDTGTAVGSVAGGWSLTVSTTATPPAVASITRDSGNPTAGTSVLYRVKFTQPVTPPDPADFAVTTVDGSVTGSVGLISMFGDPTTWIVPVGSLDGYGVFRLDFVDDDSVTNGSSVPVGGVGAGNGNFALGENYTKLRPNDGCAGAEELFNGSFVMTGNTYATPGGNSACDPLGQTPDVMFTYTAETCGTVTVDTCSFASFDTVISVHSDCPSNMGNTIACSDDSTLCAPMTLRSNVSFEAVAGETYYIRLSGFNFSVGHALLSLGQTSDFPFVVAFSPDPPAMYNVGPGTASLIFNQDVIGVDDSDFSYFATGTASASSTTVSGSLDSYQVTYSGLSGDGELWPTVAFGADIFSGCDGATPLDTSSEIFASDYIMVDNTDPDGGSAEVDSTCIGSSSVTVEFSGAFDPLAGGVASGLASTELWYSFEGGPWTPTGMSSPNSSGSFDFQFNDGPGDYCFAMVGTDNVGNVEAAPTGSGDDCVEYDATPTNAVCQDISICLDDFGSATITPGQINNGSTGSCGIASIFLDRDTFSCSDLSGPQTVILTVVDNNGGYDTCDAEVTVEDCTDPEIFLCAPPSIQAADGNCEATLPDFTGGVTASDNCDTNLTITQSPLAGTTVGLGVTNVTLTVTDDAGNFATCGTDFTVVDETDPTINQCADDQSATADASCSALVPDFTGDVDASDNCDTNLTITQSPTAGTPVTIGDTTVTITVTDDAGNFTTCDATFTVTDDTDPTINACADDQSASADAACSALVPDFTGDVDASDNCDTNLTVTQSPTAGTPVTLGDTTVTITVTDDAGNFTTCDATFTVTDETAPSITECADDQSASADANCLALVPDFTGEVSASDNCDTNVAITQSPTAGTPVTIGDTTVTITATDDSGNFDTCTATFTVTDDTDPVIENCADNQSAPADSNCSALVPDMTGDVAAADNCDTNLTVTQSPIPGTTVGLGGHTITFTVTDDAGNFTTCQSTFTVTDTTDPVAVCQAATVFIDGSGFATVTPAMVDGGSTDNCGIASATVVPNTFNCSHAGTVQQVTLTVFDAAGNSDSCIANVTVDGSQSVTAICQDITICLDASGNATITPAQVDNGSTDPCGFVTLTLDRTTFNCADAAATFAGNPPTVTLTVENGNGDIDTCVATVNVNDCQDPVIQDCPGDLTTTCNTNGGFNLSYTPTVIDNCSTTFTQNPPNPIPYGSNVVTITVTDVSGNTDTCTFNVTVTPDLQEPIRMFSVAALDGTVSQGGAADALLTSIDVGDYADNQMRRGIVSFNTSAIPASAIITSVRFRFTQFQTFGNPAALGTLRLDMGNSLIGSSSALNADDYPNDAAFFLDVATSFPAPGGNGFTTFVTLNPTRFNDINRSGSTQFRLRYSGDSNNNNQADYLAFHSGETEDQVKPEMIVEYYLGDCFQYPAPPTPNPTIFTVDFFSDPALDGYVTESHWTSQVGGTVNLISGTAPVGDTAARQPHQIILSFDTSSLPDNATIVSAQLRMFNTSRIANPASLGSIQVDIRNPYLSPTSFRYGALNQAEMSDFQVISHFPSVATLPLPPASNQFTQTLLNSTGIQGVNKLGLTQMKLRYTLEDNGNATADSASFGTGNYGALSPGRPRLQIQYRIP